MTKKIFHSMFFVASVAMLLGILLIMGVLFAYFRTVQKNRLVSELRLTAAAVEMGGEAYLESFQVDDCRLTWVGADGIVLFDSQGETADMENHADREEVKEALETGKGESSRYSTTLMEETLYCAKRLSDGTVLRISVSYASVPALLFGLLQPLLVVFVIALLCSILLSKRLSRKIVQPLNAIDLDQPLENEAYDELSPLLTHIGRQQREISAQKQELEDRQDEFYTVIENMNEGLVLLNAKGIILSINPAALAFFHADTAVGRDLIEIERSPEIEKAFESAAQHGKSSLQVSRSGREYQVNLNRIGPQNDMSGMVLLIFDITEKVFAERNRQEFTANVSHELKTPLHSIMGSAELLENGLVKEEDIPRFIGHIRNESARLVALIEDIIRLSQLDEASAPEMEPVELYELAAGEVESLTQPAKAKNVSISMEGESVTISGVRQLLHEVIYNLCDNAIKYNVDGGWVKVRVSKTADGAALVVADSGIGIPAEHQDRIFERFYRVDKSHSKETGGTGLGLSIVKHAVQYMGGTISLDSTPGVGTTVTVSFHKKESRP